jgi:hypothetical protein
MAELDDLQRLVGSMQDWAARTFPPPAEHEASCQWCPLCQLMTVLRGERGDLAEKLTEAGGALLASLRALLDAAAAPRADEPRVQRIDLDTDTDTDTDMDQD